MQFLCNFSGPRTAYKFLLINCFCCRMGVSLSCPFAKCNNVEDGLDSIIAKSINFAYDEIKTSPVRSASFTNEDDLEPTILKSKGSKENMTIEAPRLSFKRKHMENTTSTETLVFDKEMDDDQSLGSKCQVEKIQSALVVPNNPEHMAALKLQKVYRSFRTRRKLADCAVLIEQSWYFIYYCNEKTPFSSFTKFSCVSDLF